jgi:hypothetical protein
VDESRNDLKQRGFGPLTLKEEKDMYFKKVVLSIEEPGATHVEPIPDVERILIWSDSDDPNVPSLQFDGDEDTTVHIRIREDGVCRVLVRPEREIPHRIFLRNDFDEVEIEQDAKSFTLYRDAGDWWDSRDDSCLPVLRSN